MGRREAGGAGGKKIHAALTEGSEKGEINKWPGTEKWGVRGHGERRDKQKIVRRSEALEKCTQHNVQIHVGANLTKTCPGLIKMKRRKKNCVKIMKLS